MKASWKDGVSYLDGKPMPQNEIWAILRTEFIKALKNANK